MGVLTGRRESRQWAPEPVVPPYLGAPSSYGQSGVSGRPDTALAVPAVWACVTLLANAVSMLPLQTYRRTGDVPARITDPMLVSSPDADLTQSEWLHMLMVSLLLRGNAFALKTGVDSMARPTQLTLLSPDKVRTEVGSGGSVRYLLGAGQTDVTSRMWHVRGLTLPGSKIGLSPIQYAAQAIGVDLSSRKFAQDFFDNGGVPKATLTSTMELTQEQARTAKERLMAATQNREPAVFGSGITYKPISVSAEESQFLATQRANISEIARYFGIPAEMIGGETGSSLTYSNVEQRSLDFLTYGVAFWLKRIEDSFFNLLPQPQYVKFRVEELLRIDAHSRAQVDMFQIASKVKTPTEVRNTYGLPPMTEAQQVEADMVPLSIGPLGRPTATPALKELPGPAAPTPPDDQQGGPNG